MQVQVPTKECSSFIFSFFLLQCCHKPYSNLATTLQQGCNSFNSMVFATLWQPCSEVVVDNLATGLQQGCSKLVWVPAIQYTLCMLIIVIYLILIYVTQSEKTYLLAQCKFEK